MKIKIYYKLKGVLFESNERSNKNKDFWDEYWNSIFSDKILFDISFANS